MVLSMLSITSFIWSAKDIAKNSDESNKKSPIDVAYAWAECLSWWKYSI